MGIDECLIELGPEIDDVDEETFVVFANAIQTRDLGMIDARAKTIELEISIDGHSKTLTIQQSPGLLNSKREEGTTGAVLWAVTPLFAEWIASSNFLFKYRVLHERSIVLELGAGIGGVAGLALSPVVGHCVLTDQDYVIKLLCQNIHDNAHVLRKEQPQEQNRGQKRTKKKTGNGEPVDHMPIVMVLDWETSSLQDFGRVLARELWNNTADGGRNSDELAPLDVVIACDCIYNEALIEPFVKMCEMLCQPCMEPRDRPQTVCVIAQQLRSPEVFESWLTRMIKTFQVWRVPESLLSSPLRETSGFVVHTAVLRL